MREKREQMEQDLVGLPFYICRPALFLEVPAGETDRQTDKEGKKEEYRRQINCAIHVPEASNKKKLRSLCSTARWPHCFNTSMDRDETEGKSVEREGDGQIRDCLLWDVSTKECLAKVSLL